MKKLIQLSALAIMAASPFYGFAKEIVCQTTEKNGGQAGYSIVKQWKNEDDPARTINYLRCEQPGDKQCAWEGGKSPCQGGAIYNGHPIQNDIIIKDDNGAVMPVSAITINNMIIGSMNQGSTSGNFVIGGTVRVIYTYTAVAATGENIMNVRILTGANFNVY